MTKGCSSSAEIESLKEWAESQLDSLEYHCEGNFNWSPLNGDAGFRRYFRTQTTPPFMVALSPPETEDNPAFVNIAAFLRENGIHVPKVLAHDYERGFLLEEDLGETLFFDCLTTENVEVLYGEALFTLLRIQQCKTTSLFSSYNQAFLLTEMRLLQEWMVDKLLGMTLSDDETAMLDGFYSLIVDSALEQPQVIVHRDFHSKNMVYCEDGSTGVIDFQGALSGPFTYDLASLLKDCYLRWEPEQVRRWAIAYANMAIDVGILKPVSEEQFLRWFDWMGLQRHIKVLGLFARLALRDGKEGYLRELPRVVRYVEEVVERYPQLDDFASWFKQQLLPALKKQPWFSQA
ncbi:aminoglycoside phosphotransferase family protein [Teredinibacter sp. KSP-S5-2]|uniref:aminoglycoside phosphotransferase family protein n=1 Tax=Teredinibacter sp. KSP-S5-2 TaxID=3034506 RepID=UPI0029348334|nr:phosphotransferase [Teredinibacter sp. KSP-S5-2]WNO08594.1 phosphotransferase [Teredinibacter sp. KSP-S5-2]